MCLLVECDPLIENQMAGKQKVNDGKNFRGRRVRRIKGALTGLAQWRAGWALAWEADGPGSGLTCEGQ